MEKIKTKLLGIAIILIGIVGVVVLKELSVAIFFSVPALVLIFGKKTISDYEDMDI